MDKQIFISYSRVNREFALKLYQDLLKEGYPVWIDKAIEEIEEWKPQIEHHLRRSNRFIVLISTASVNSKWVTHEGSMAYALGQRIIPLKIEEFGRYVASDLPIWVQDDQLADFVENEIEYKNRFRRLKQFLGDPLPIQKLLEDMTAVHNATGALLDEVALELIEKHKDEIEYPEGAMDLIDKSRRALKDYWVRYDDLEGKYEASKREIEVLEERVGGLERSISRVNNTLQKSHQEVKNHQIFLILLGICVFFWMITAIYYVIN